MTPDFHPGDRGSRQALAGCFYLQVYISPPTTFGAVTRMTTVRAHLRSHKRALEFLNICNKCFIVAWRNAVVQLAKYIVYSVYSI